MLVGKEGLHVHALNIPGEVPPRVLLKDAGHIVSCRACVWFIGMEFNYDMLSNVLL